MFYPTNLYKGNGCCKRVKEKNLKILQKAFMNTKTIFPPFKAIKGSVDLISSKSQFINWHV